MAPNIRSDTFKSVVNNAVWMPLFTLFPPGLSDDINPCYQGSDPDTLKRRCVSQDSSEKGGGGTLFAIFCQFYIWKWQIF